MSNRWSYLRGAVQVSVQGDGVERFINLALGRGIRLWDIRRFPQGSVLISLYPRDFCLLRPLARKTRCRVHIRRKHGLPFTIDRIWGQRRMLVWGALFFLLAMFVLSSRVWTVDVLSQEELRYTTVEQVLQTAREEGLAPGVARSRVDTGAVEKHLQNRIPELAWVGIDVRGTRVTVRVVEKQLIPGDLQSQDRAHLVAAKDGVVKEILVMAGEAKVVVGETVTRGQVLIAGNMPPPEAGVAPGTGAVPAPAGFLRARGIVRARVWYQTEEEVPLILVQEVPTGRQSLHVSLKIGAKEVILKRGGRGFAHYQVEQNVKYLRPWRSLRQPVEIITATYHEVERETRELGLEGARQEARRRGMARLLEQIPAGVQVLDWQAEVVAQDAQSVKLRLLAETVEDIAELQPF